MSESRERALLRRLDKAEADLRAVGGYENELQYIPAGGVRSLLADLRALLAEPEGCEDDIHDELCDCNQSRPHLSRAEGSDLSVDQGREFRVVDGLGDNNRAGKVTIDPTLLSPPTPHSRTEAEAMLKRYHAALMAQSVPEDVADAMRERQRAYNALLAALAGREGNRMTRPRTLVPGQLPDGSWASPKDLRCVGGPGDGQWFSHPPLGYARLEERGGATWRWMDDLWPPNAMPGAER